MSTLYLVLLIFKLDSIVSQISSNHFDARTSDISNMFIVTKIPIIDAAEYQKSKTFMMSSSVPWTLCRNELKQRVRHCHHEWNASHVEIARFMNNKERPFNKTLEQMMKKGLHRQMSLGERRLRGFSPWSAWSVCSRKCMTTRNRYCMIPTICGNKILRQSAYCYYEGSFCQLWIRHKIKRKNQEYYKDEVASASTPALGFHKEDSYQFPATPDCGKLGHYQGSRTSQMRAHLHDMLRIIGGRPAPPGKWPWQVVVLNRYKEAFCGGTLVSLRWVVTAAHCVRKKLYIRLGEHDLFIRNRGEVEMKVTEAVIHPDYDPATVFNDVAMLRLPDPAQPSLGHGIACLPDPSQVLAPRTSCVILGWGKRRASDVHGTRLLHEAQVSTIDQAVCRRSYWQYAINENMVCAGRGRRDSCAGDSGGPLLCQYLSRYYLQGITSFGDGCGKKGKYGIYTRTRAYVPWMRDVMDKTYLDD